MAQPSNLWTVMGLVPFFVVFFRPSGCERLQEEPPSLRAEREGDQEFPWLFVRPSRILFARKEGWNMPCYPRWARAVTFPVSFYRVSPSGGPCPIR